jgi:CLIP-associating protein 1/2
MDMQITSSRDLENEFAGMLKPFDVCLITSISMWCSLTLSLQGKETEHNWAAREKAILRVRGMLKGDVHTRYMDTFLACLKDGYIKSSLKTVSTPRNINSSLLTARYLSPSACQLANDGFC